ncbi:MAG: hypothetical protein J3Q66DRAFT_344077 [Benniella sp.]|nr:MAG: hypothetical protein J3Q66DRAFT_344077 [Benniella sp.]
MTFFAFVRKDKRQRSTKMKRSTPSRALSLSSTSHLDSAYASSTLSCSTALSGVSVISQRSSSESSVSSEEHEPTWDGGNPDRDQQQQQQQHCHGAPTPTRHLQSTLGPKTKGSSVRPSETYASPAKAPSKVSSPPSPPPSAPSVRVKFKAAFSRFLPRYREGPHDPCDFSENRRHVTLATALQDNAGVLFTSAAPLTPRSARPDRDRLNGFQLFHLKRRRQQQKRLCSHAMAHKTGHCATTTPAAAASPLSSITVHPLSISPMLPMPVPVSPLSPTLPPLDPTAPACFPGAGPVDMATKHQQLLELKQSCKRPCSSSTRPTPLVSATTAVATASALPPILLQNRSGRHLIPHHRHDWNGQDPQSMGSCPPSPSTSSSSISSFLPFGRRPSVESLTLLGAATNAPGATATAASYGPPSPYSHNRPYQWPVASLSPFSNDHPSLPRRSTDGLEMLKRPVMMSRMATSQSLPDSRRGSTQSVQSQSAVTNTGRSLPWSADPNLMEQRMKCVAGSTTRTIATSVAKVPLGQGYDISTMFKMGPLHPTTASPAIDNALA